jgi:hypothetical protein
VFKKQDDILIHVIKFILLLFSILPTINTKFSNFIHLVIPKTELMCNFFNIKYKVLIVKKKIELFFIFKSY